MEIHVLGSGSSGNCYIFQTAEECLVVECGVPFRQVLQKIDFQVAKIAGCIVSHSHGDHAGNVKDFIRHGVPVYGAGGAGLNDRQQFKIGGFTIRPVQAVHDVETFLFLIHHAEAGVVAHITDTHYVPHKLAGINYWMIEANFDTEIMDRNIEAGRIPSVVRNRVLQSHMSIDTAIDCLKANDLSTASGIMLLHLSSGNSNGEAFKNRVVMATGLPVEIAEPGLCIELSGSETPF